MVNRMMIWSNWRSRSESLDDSVVRLNETFSSLARLSLHWNVWWRGYKSVADRNSGPLLLRDRLNVISEEMRNGKLNNDELGYFISASAGNPKGKGTEMSTLRLHCCSATPLVSNSLVMEFPVHGFAGDIYDSSVIGEVFCILADIWDPEWLSALTRRPDMVNPPWPGGLEMGWVNYLSRQVGSIEGELPEKWQWYEKRQRRQIFLHEYGVPDVGNSHHVSAFTEMFRRIQWNFPITQSKPMVSEI